MGYKDTNLENRMCIVLWHVVASISELFIEIEITLCMVHHLLVEPRTESQIN